MDQSMVKITWSFVVTEKNKLRSDDIRPFEFVARMPRLIRCPKDTKGSAHIFPAVIMILYMLFYLF
jgi:hypothetical protein